MLDIKTVTGGPLDVNTYVVALDGAAECVLIDPGAEYAVVNGCLLYTSNPGVIGLAASRLVEKYKWPTVLLSQDGDVCVGSARSIPGVNIHQAMSTLSLIHILRMYRRPAE